VKPNPYTSPESDLGRPPRRAAFEVGLAERHLVEAFLSLWGTEVYAVDGVEVLRRKPELALRTTTQFDVGETEKHQVEVRFDMRPACNPLRWRPPWWTAEVYVDGELVVDELFPVLRRRLAAISRVLNCVLLASLALLVVLLLVLASLNLLVPVLFSP